MPRDSTKIQQRNQHIITRYRFHRKKNPKWTVMAVIEEVANEFYLSPVTISMILKSESEDVPCHATVLKYTRAIMIS